MRNAIGTFFLAGLIVLAAVVPAVAQGADPVAVLKSGASLEEKQEACRQLSIRGTAEAVPVLSELLVDEQLSHMARHALEPMPHPEAGQALRDALGKTNGRLKVGVVNSLGIRKDEQTVPELIALLSDADPAVAQASALSLGMIATPDAATALKEAIARGAAPERTLNALYDGLLGCAETFALKPEQKNAGLALYDYLLGLPNAPATVRTAALRGAVLNRGADSFRLVADRLVGQDTDGFFAALRVARELKADHGVAAAIADVLPATTPEREVLILDLFGEGDSDAAGAAVLARATDGTPEVRVAALRAVTRMHFSPAVDTLARLAWTEEGEIAKVARDSLAYFAGPEGDRAIEALLHNEDPKARGVAVALVADGGLDNPGTILLKTAETDADEGVRLAALEGLHDYAGLEEMQGLLNKMLQSTSPAEARAAESALAALSERMKRMPGGIVVTKAVYGDLPDGPSVDVLDKVAALVAAGTPAVTASNANFGDPAPGAVKKLRVNYTDNGSPVSRTVGENETLRFASAVAPATVVDAFCAAMDRAQGDARLAVIRLLGTTGGAKAFELVRANATSGEGAVKDTALRTLCDWPSADALPVLSELSQSSTEPAVQLLALGGVVRLLGGGAASPADALAQYAAMMDKARSPEEKKLIMSGVAQVPTLEAFTYALNRMSDPDVKAEAVQAAIAVAGTFGSQGRQEDRTVFNGKDLTGWQGNEPYWRVEDGAIVGQSTEPLKSSEFLWSNVPVGNFYLAVDVLLEPNTGNSGIQFRSKKIDEHGQALGYQADMGQGVWGHLYHERGRGKLDWVGDAETAVKPGEWNRIEILAIGPAIWTALNGKIGVACFDPEGANERTGLVGFQLHAGLVETARFKVLHLVHNPRMIIGGLYSNDLIPMLRSPEKQP